MGKRLIISEEEKRNIQEMHGLINEDNKLQINEAYRTSVIQGFVDFFGDFAENLGGGASLYLFATEFIELFVRGASSVASLPVLIMNELKRVGIVGNAANKVLDAELPSSMLEFLTYNLRKGVDDDDAEVAEELGKLIENGEIKTLNGVMKFVGENNSGFY